MVTFVEMKELVRKLQYFFLNWDKSFSSFSLVILHVISATVLVYVAYKLYDETGVDIHHLNRKPDSLFLFISASVLMCFNWSLESVKWQVFLSPTLFVSFFSALKSILYGTALGVITPNRVGDYSGRAQFVPPEYRGFAVTAALFSGLAQNAVTFLGGAVALFCLGMHYFPDYKDWSFLWSAISLLISLIFLFVYYFPRSVLGLFRLFRLNAGVSYMEKIVVRYPIHILLASMSLSMCRYLIFCIQYWLLVNCFADVGFVDSFVAIGCTYVINTLLPSNQLVELGLRATVPVAVLASVGVDAEVAVAGAVLLWGINLFIPSVAGFVIRTVSSRSLS